MITVGAVIGLLCLCAVVAMIYAGLPYTNHPVNPCCCRMIDLRGAHFYVERGAARIHEPERCGPTVEWLGP